MNTCGADENGNLHDLKDTSRDFSKLVGTGEIVVT
jgi:hypothetical protein